MRRPCCFENLVRGLRGLAGAPGEHPVPRCLVAHELRTGRRLRIWEDELRQLAAQPYAVDKNALFIAYYAPAETLCHHVLGWAMPVNILDLYVEFKCIANGLEPPCGYGLLRGSWPTTGSTRDEPLRKRKAMRVTGYAAPCGGPYSGRRDRRPARLLRDGRHRVGKAPAGDAATHRSAACSLARRGRMPAVSRGWSTLALPSGACWRSCTSAPAGRGSRIASSPQSTPTSASSRVGASARSGSAALARGALRIAVQPAHGDRTARARHGHVPDDGACPPRAWAAARAATLAVAAST